MRTQYYRKNSSSRRKRSKAMVKAFDTNHDGRVSYMDFAEFYIAIEEKFVYFFVNSWSN